MRLQFAKMHGLGNDFVIFDARHQNVHLSGEQLRWIADRKTGIGCDQIIVITPASDAGIDYNYKIYNANGTEVEQCGNGARCVGKFLALHGLADTDPLTIKTISGIYRVHLRDDGLVTIDMGIPIFEPEKIPFTGSAEVSDQVLAVAGQQVKIGVVCMGNPHAVVQVDDINHAPVTTLGPGIETHTMFPNHVNVGFMQILDTRHIALRVFERGVGETRACGSGACAAVAIGQARGQLGACVTVQLPGGELQIECKGTGEPIFMTGAAQLSFEGSLTL